MTAASLVLEGGGMRGLFTAGVLDFFLDNKILFQNNIGVSAGVCHGLSYVCGQRGRARDVAVDYLHLKNYCGMYSLLTTGDIFNVKTVYKTIPGELYPLDASAYKNSGVCILSVVTNCSTGKAEYIRINDPMGDVNWVRASASLPLVSHRVEIDGKYYLDGGIADSVPIEKSIELWGGKQVVVLTQPKGFIKQKDSLYPLMKLRYSKYPAMLEKIKNRHLYYNKTVKKIEELEARGEIFVIRPESSLNVGRVEKDREKLLKIYEIGYSRAEKEFERIKKYLNI